MERKAERAFLMEEGSPTSVPRWLSPCKVSLLETGNKHHNHAPTTLSNQAGHIKPQESTSPSCDQLEQSRIMPFSSKNCCGSAHASAVSRRPGLSHAWLRESPAAWAALSSQTREDLGLSVAIAASIRGGDGVREARHAPDLVSRFLQLQPQRRVSRER